MVFYRRRALIEWGPHTGSTRATFITLLYFDQRGFPLCYTRGSATGPRFSDIPGTSDTERFSLTNKRVALNNFAIEKSLKIGILGTKFLKDF